MNPPAPIKPEPKAPPRGSTRLGLREDAPLWARAALGAGCLGVVFGIWALATSGDEGSYLIPPPGDVLGSFGKLVEDRDLISNIFISLRRVILGFGLAVGGEGFVPASEPVQDPGELELRLRVPRLDLHHGALAALSRLGAGRHAHLVVAQRDGLRVLVAGLVSDPVSHDL